MTAEDQSLWTVMTVMRRAGGHDKAMIIDEWAVKISIRCMYDKEGSNSGEHKADGPRKAADERERARRVCGSRKNGQFD